MRKFIFLYTILFFPAIGFGASDSTEVGPLVSPVPNVASVQLNPSANTVSNQQYWSGNHGSIVSCGANTISCPDINGNYASGGNSQPGGTQCPSLCWVSRTVSPSYTSNFPAPVTGTTDAFCPPSYVAIATYQAGSDVVMSTNNPNIPATTPASFYPKGIDEYNQLLLAGYTCSPASALPRGLNYLNFGSGNNTYPYQGGSGNANGGGEITFTLTSNALAFQACFLNNDNNFVNGQGAQGFVPYPGQPTDTINPYLLNASSNGTPTSTTMNVGGVVILSSYSVNCYDGCSGSNGNGKPVSSPCTVAQSAGIGNCCRYDGGVSISANFQYLSCTPASSGSNGNVGLNYTGATIPTVVLCAHAKPAWQPINQ